MVTQYSRHVLHTIDVKEIITLKISDKMTTVILEQLLYDKILEEAVVSIGKSTDNVLQFSRGLIQ